MALCAQVCQTDYFPMESASSIFTELNMMASRPLSIAGFITSQLLLSLVRIVIFFTLQTKLPLLNLSMHSADLSSAAEKFVGQANDRNGNEQVGPQSTDACDELRTNVVPAKPMFRDRFSSLHVQVCSGRRKAVVRGPNVAILADTNP